MKKIMLTAAVAVAFLGARLQTAQAHEGCAAGAIFGGIIAGAIIADALQPHTVVYTTSYCPPPAPVVYAPACETRVVYAAPRPVVYEAAPVCYEPACVIYREPSAVRFGFGYVRPWHHHHDCD